MSSSHLLTGFVRPHSLHPKIHLELSGPGIKDCDLHAIIRTNDKIFFDPYELEDLWKSNTRSFAPSGWSLVPPVPDLERPVKYGFRSTKGNNTMDAIDYRAVENTLYMRVEGNQTPGPHGAFVLQVPAHARYQQPNDSGYTEVTIAGKDATTGGLASDVDVRAVWACSSAQSDLEPTMLRESTNDIIQHIDASYLYNIEPSAPDRIISRVPITSSVLLPAARPSHQAWVEVITLFVILGCFFWIIKALVEVARRPEDRAKTRTE